MRLVARCVQSALARQIARLLRVLESNAQFRRKDGFGGWTNDQHIAAGLYVVHQLLFERRLQIVALGDHDERPNPHPTGQVVFADDIDRPLTLEQRLQGAADPREIAIEQPVHLAVVPSGRIEQSHLRHGGRMVTDRLPLPAELRDLRHHGKILLANRAVPHLRVVELETASEGQHHCGLALQLRR